MSFWVQAADASCAPSVDSIDSLDDDQRKPWPRPRHQEPFYLDSPDARNPFAPIPLSRQQNPFLPDPTRSASVCFTRSMAHRDDYDTHASRTPSPHWRNGGSFRTHGCYNPSSSSSSHPVLSSSLSSSPQPHWTDHHTKQHSQSDWTSTDWPARAVRRTREWETGRQSPLSNVSNVSSVPSVPSVHSAPSVQQQWEEEEQQYRDERDHPWDEPWPPKAQQRQYSSRPSRPTRPEVYLACEQPYEPPPLPPPPPPRALHHHDYPPDYSPDSSSDAALMTDAEAAARVAAHLATVTRRCPAARHERILLGLIHPKSAAAAYALDAGALESLFLAANALFFYGKLTRRVRWEWDDADTAMKKTTTLLGHTLLRRVRGSGGPGAPAGGFETLIRLSRPLLTDRRYGRRLLLSAFLHELIHCYLFVCCGWRARAGGGHTAGFRAIADTIDRWAGPANNLHLRHVEADLERFRQDAALEAVTGEW